MNEYVLAIDIGASSGRHILGRVEGGQLRAEEVYRFENGAVTRDGHAVWDVGRLFGEVVAGMKRCAALGKIPLSVGIDTWGVDYALLDKSDRPIGPVYCYRDTLRCRAAESVHAVVPYEELYRVAGTQFQPFNTVYQLYDDKLSGRLEKAETLLMLPSYLSFLLSGVKANEYTDASTTGLLDAEKRDWAYGVIDALGYPKRLFSKPVMPSLLGRLKKDVAAEVGFDCAVTLPATHDTASAVMSVTDRGAIYISSGTWSLMGREILQPLLSDEARRRNYTNEGAADGSIRFLKNIMGLWLIQSYRREIGKRYDFAELAAMAEREAAYEWALDVDDRRFLAPERMSEAIAAVCRDAGAPVPATPGQTAHCIFSSLAHAYAASAASLDELLGEKTGTIEIVGGGSRNGYLNRLTERYSGRKVSVGHPEATAAGNLGAQMLAIGLLPDAQAFRRAVAASI